MVSCKTQIEYNRRFLLERIYLRLLPSSSKRYCTFSHWVEFWLGGGSSGTKALKTMTQQSIRSKDNAWNAMQETSVLLGCHCPKYTICSILVFVEEVMVSATGVVFLQAPYKGKQRNITFMYFKSFHHSQICKATNVLTVSETWQESQRNRHR